MTDPITQSMIQGAAGAGGAGAGGAAGGGGAGCMSFLPPSLLSPTSNLLQ